MLKYNVRLCVREATSAKRMQRSLIVASTLVTQKYFSHFHAFHVSTLPNAISDLQIFKLFNCYMLLCICFISPFFYRAKRTILMLLLRERIFVRTIRIIDRFHCNIGPIVRKIFFWSWLRIDKGGNVPRFFI